MKTKVLIILFCIGILELHGQETFPAYVNADKVTLSTAYSHAIMWNTQQEGKVIRTSGIIGTTPDGKLVVSSPKAQIKQAFDNIKEILKRSGADVNDIVEINTFLLDSTHLRPYALERRDLFMGRANPMVISKTYYTKGLINSKAIVEIDVTAMVPTISSTNNIHVTAVVKARKGKAVELGNILKSNITPTLNEKGCISYELFQSKKDEHIYTLHEQWESEDSLKKHFEMPYMKSLNDLGEELIEQTEIYITTKLKES